MTCKTVALCLARVLLSSMLATAFLPTAHADSVPIDGVPLFFTGTAQNQTNIFSYFGGPTSDTGDIVSSVDGLPIVGGSLSFATAAATSSFIFPCGFDNTYSAGGTWTLTGQIFGLPAGSVLLSGNLGSGETISECENPLAISYSTNNNVNLFVYGSATDANSTMVTYVNPTLLLNLPGDYSSPVLVQVTNEFDNYPDLSKVTMNSLVGVAPSPEPSSLLLLGTGLLGALGVMRRKLLG